MTKIHSLVELPKAWLSRTTLRAGAIALALLGGTDLAQAAHIGFDATVDGSISVIYGGFENGLSLNGSSVPFNGYSGTTLTYSDAAPVTFLGSWFDVGSNSAFSRSIFWVSELDPSQITAMLTFSVSPDGSYAIIDGSFSVGALGTLPGGVLATDLIIQKVDGSQDPFGPVVFLANYLSSSVSVGPLDVAPVPLPASAPALVLGLAALGIAARRRKAA